MTPPNRIFRTALSTGVPFGAFMGLYFSFQSGVVPGMLAGTLTGLLFGASIAIFVERQRKRLEIKGPDFEGARILLQGPANHLQRAEARGGWLILTDAGLVFRSHGKNIQNAEVRIALSEVRRASPYRTLGVIPNGLRLEKANGTEESFVLLDRASWVAGITSALAPTRSE